MFDWIADRLSDILFMFPDSPFQKISIVFDDVNLLSYINWVIPFDLVSDITGLWLIGIMSWKVWGLIYGKLRSIVIWQIMISSFLQINLS